MEKRYWGVYFSDCCENDSLADVVFSEKEAEIIVEQFNDDPDMTCEEWYYYEEVSKEKAEKFLERWG